MSIKDRFRRALRKSDSSSSLSQSDTNTTTATTTTNNSQSSLPGLIAQQSQKPPPVALSKTFTWGAPNKDKEREKAEKRAEKKKQAARRAGKPMHPREKPLTEQNLRHQEMLGHFTMTFGATHALGEGPFGGVSPCCTRPASIADSDEFGPFGP